MNEHSTQKKQKNKAFGHIILVIVCIGLGIWIYHDFIKYRIFPKRFGVVQQDCLYRSGQISASLMKKTLQKYNIKVIVDMTNPDPEDPGDVEETKVAGELGIQRHILPLNGKGLGDYQMYVEALKIINEAKKQNHAVLVHCVAGTQRTGGVIALYRLLYEKKSPDLVISEMQKYGWRYDDNPELIDFLNQNIKTIAEQLVQSGDLAEVPDPIPVLKAK